MYVKYCSVVPIGRCHCPGYLHFHWLFCIKFWAVDRRSASLFNEVRFRGNRNVLVCIISTLLTCTTLYQLKLCLECTNSSKQALFLWDALDSTGCWLSVCCVGVWWNLISGICYIDLNFINNYKKFQFWWVILRYNVNMISPFSIGCYSFNNQTK